MHKNELLGRYVASSCIPNIFTQVIAGMRKRKPMKWQLLKRELNVKCEREVEEEAMRKKRMVTRQGVNV